MKLACKYGHLLTPDNLYISKYGRRNCKTCALERSRLARAAKRAPKQPALTCRKGHERTPENTYRDSKGYPRCKVCQSIRDTRRYHAGKKKLRLNSVEFKARDGLCCPTCGSINMRKRKYNDLYGCRSCGSAFTMADITRYVEQAQKKARPRAEPAPEIAGGAYRWPEKRSIPQYKF